MTGTLPAGTRLEPAARIEAVRAVEGARLRRLARLLAGGPRAGDDLVEGVLRGAARALTVDDEALATPAWPQLRAALAATAVDVRGRAGLALRQGARRRADLRASGWGDATQGAVAALHRLPALTRTCVVLADVEGMGEAAIAGVLRAPPGLVGARLASGRRALALRLGAGGAGEVAARLRRAGEEVAAGPVERAGGAAHSGGARARRLSSAAALGAVAVVLAAVALTTGHRGSASTPAVPTPPPVYTARSSVSAPPPLALLADLGGPRGGGLVLDALDWSGHLRGRLVLGPVEAHWAVSDDGSRVFFGDTVFDRSGRSLGQIELPQSAAGGILDPLWADDDSAVCALRDMTAGPATIRQQVLLLRPGAPGRVLADLPEESVVSSGWQVLACAPGHGVVVVGTIGDERRPARSLVLSAASGAVAAALDLGPTAGTTSLAASPDGGYLAVSGAAGVAILDPHDGARLGQVRRGIVGGPLAEGPVAAFSGDASRLLVVAPGADGGAAVVDWRTEMVLARLPDVAAMAVRPGAPDLLLTLSTPGRPGTSLLLVDRAGDRRPLLVAPPTASPPSSAQPG